MDNGTICDDIEMDCGVKDQDRQTDRQRSREAETGKHQKQAKTDPTHPPSPT